jgi:hypothetical protein
MSYARHDTPIGTAGYSIGDRCPFLACGIPIDRGVTFLCGNTPGEADDYGCGRWFCMRHLSSPDGLNLLGGGLCPVCAVQLEHPLGEDIVRGCTECPGDDLCAHEVDAVPLAATLAQHFDPIAHANDPLTGAFVLDAFHLLDQLGDGPYETRELYPDDLPDSPCHRGVLINDQVIGFLPGGPVDAVAVRLGELTPA